MCDRRSVEIKIVPSYKFLSSQSFHSNISRRDSPHLAPTRTCVHTNSLPHLHYCLPHRPSVRPSAHPSSMTLLSLHHSVLPFFVNLLDFLPLRSLLFPHAALAVFFFLPLSSPFVSRYLALPFRVCLSVLALLFLRGGGAASAAYPSSPSLITSAVPSPCRSPGPIDSTRGFFFLLVKWLNSFHRLSTFSYRRRSRGKKIKTCLGKRTQFFFFNFF